MELLFTNRGIRQVAYEGYLYHKNKMIASGITYWECVQRRDGDGCKRRFVISADDTLLRVAIEHSHPPTPDKIEGIRSRAGMKRTAHNTNEKTHNILITHLVGLSQETLSQLPNSETLKRDIRRQRRPNHPPVPAANCKQFVLPQPYTVTNAGERFLLYDNREDRLLLFGTDRSIAHLAQCNHWFMDGTFKTSPLQSTQVYSIHGFSEGQNIACAYALLPDKRAILPCAKLAIFSMATISVNITIFPWVLWVIVSYCASFPG